MASTSNKISDIWNTNTLRWDTVSSSEDVTVHYNVYSTREYRELEKVFREREHELKLVIANLSKTPKIKDVIFNGPCTIVFWSDGTKTVVHCENEEFDKEKGLAMAICKKHMGNTGRYFETIKKYTRE